jgi:hypothetical protein
LDETVAPAIAWFERWVTRKPQPRHFDNSLIH